MKTKSLVLTALLLTSGAAMAQEYVIERVEVRPSADAPTVISMDCDNLQQPRAIDVESLLNVKDRTQTQALGNKLMGAIAEACHAGIPTIVVARGQSGESVTWTPVGDYAPPPQY